MTEQMRLSIEVGMKVMVKVGAREIPATVIEVREDCFLVKSMASGKEFTTTRVTDILESPAETEAAGEATAPAEDAAAAPRAEETAVAKTESEGTAETEASLQEQPAGTGESAAETAAEPPEETEETPEEGEKPEAEHSAEKPRKNLSLVDAAVEVLKAEKRPMNVKELVKLATERGLWIPTKCKTPEQSLYGGLYLDMKNSASPRVKKSSEKGKFELA